MLLFSPQSPHLSRVYLLQVHYHSLVVSGARVCGVKARVGHSPSKYNVLGLTDGLRTGSISRRRLTRYSVYLNDLRRSLALRWATGARTVLKPRQQSVAPMR